MPSLVSLAARDCRVPEAWVEEVLRLGPSRVKTLQIKKKNSEKYRTISRPSAELEILQRWLILRFFNCFKVHDSAMAFRKQRSILVNAERHQKSEYFLRVDFKGFFRSIRFLDLVHTLEKTEFGVQLTKDYPDSLNFIERVCFDASHRLPIGYISSPVISNAVMYEFDAKLSEVLNLERNTLGDARLTRYADDIVFSTKTKGACKSFLHILDNIVNDWTSPKLTINREKTIFSSKAGGSAMVTGLRICQDDHITITRAYKDKIRLMLSLYSKEVLKPEDIPILKGHLCYIRHVSPAFFSNICSKNIGIIQTLL